MAACLCLQLSLCFVLGLLLKLNEYLKRQQKGTIQKRTKQNGTFAAAPFGATKDIFPLKALQKAKVV